MDFYEEKRVQTITHILNKLFKDQYNHRFNLNIIEQNNRNAEEISNEIIQILELIRYVHFGERIDININNHSQLYGKFIDEILIDYPRLKLLYSKF